MPVKAFNTTFHTHFNINCMRSKSSSCLHALTCQHLSRSTGQQTLYYAYLQLCASQPMGLTESLIDAQLSPHLAQHQSSVPAVPCLKHRSYYNIIQSIYCTSDSWLFSCSGTHICCTDVSFSTARLPCGSRVLISGEAVLVKQLFAALHPGTQEELHQLCLSHCRFSPLPPLWGRHLALLRLVRHLASRLACLQAFLLRHCPLLQR